MRYSVVVEMNDGGCDGGGGGGVCVCVRVCVRVWYNSAAMM